jgi:hypothetical protein
MNENKKYRDVQGDAFIRKSSLLKIATGTTVISSSCILYALAMRKVKNHPYQYVKNWGKGSLVFSFSFYFLNEVFHSLSKFYQIYTNFWINNSISAYLLSKIHYRYLIKTSRMKWHSAILYSHKCFASLCVFNIIAESVISTIRYIYLYDEPDIIDYINEKIKNENDLITYVELQRNFLKPVHVINSEEKMGKMREFYKETKSKSDGKRKVMFDLYNFYKTEFKVK